MLSKNLLLGGLFVALLSTIASAEEDNKNTTSVIPSAEIQKGEVIHVIKLEDILQGKYSKEKTTPEKIITANDEKQSLVSEKTVDVVKPVAESKPIDMQAAFAAVMGYSNKPVAQAPRQAVQQKIAQQQAKPAPSSTNGQSTGWLYLGKFSQGQWDQKNNQVLGLKGALPIAGQQYSVRVFSNVRRGYPSKKGMPAIIKVLPQGSKIKLLGVHNSGNSGHYWAKVQWF